ncbi:mitochondrial chaperone BCS1 [Eremomyces bilateralis CBS 781.70]|uniref:Mitochondrial chaperone BCS1 n=1 Tax=Eremomyces bilateralis CBS 781.70 TaxID=1392243 RepID=A0A6G1FV56_9PEZI|nr:mitochondrial chaperone BCS1 [Eremomyces bilateralis CBS 781.70]KAF1809588.1 mitochondrial chaperone BCS1 [Eremomyces bilateralis CBS 781.70]
MASSSPFQPLPQGQVSVLELFFPGLSRISPVIQRYTGINLDAVVPLVCLCGFLVFLYKRGYQDISNWVQKSFSSTVHVSCNSEVHEMVLAWVSNQPFAKDSRSFLVNIDLKKGYGPGANGSVKKPLQYAPWNGELRFWYKNYPLVYRRMEKKGDLFRDREEVSISCLGWSSRILKDLLEECRQRYLDDLQGQTLIFEVRSGRWEQSKARCIRQISTVLHEDKEKEALLSDISSFLDPDTREWYTKRGIPYRRGYLLYGPPGTGKSSLSLSIAGHFDLDIYILNLASVDDRTLNMLFAQLPQHCVILLEDVDVASQSRSQDKETEHPNPMSSLSEKQGKEVTLSGLLNALDGVGSQEGRVLIMTTNYIERLDDALIRPGRVDWKIQFRLADKDIICQLFRIVFKGSDGNDNEAVERHAKNFASRVPESEFSPAEVLSLLLENRQSPGSAVARVEAWIAKVRKERGNKLKREGSWVHTA